MNERMFMPDDGTNVSNGAGASDNAEQQQQTKTFSQEEVDRIIGDRLAKERKKFEKDAEERISKAKTEAEKLAAMSAEEKAQHEREQREAELQQRELALQQRELRAEAYESLAAKGLPRELAECLSYASADACKESIKSVEKAFKAAVQSGVEERLKGTTPALGEKKRSQSNYTREQIMAVRDGVERRRLMAANIDLFPEIRKE